MKPTEYQLRQLRSEHERLKRFMEANFEVHGYDEGPKFYILLMTFALPVIGPILLLSWFLLEWWNRLFRMTKIIFNEIILILMHRFNYGKLLLVMVFVLMVLFILANVFK